MNILLRTVPHSAQRYDTVGDYYEQGDQLQLTVSAMRNNDYELLVAVHELVEQHLCKQHGIKHKDIDRFDLTYPGPGEPGNSQRCPYHQEHLAATRIEKRLAKELGVDWQQYNKTVMEL